MVVVCQRCNGVPCCCTYLEEAGVLKPSKSDLAKLMDKHASELAHLQKALNERELELLRVKAKLAVLEPFAEVMDDEFMRVVAGYEYNVPRIHKAWLAVRAAADAGKGK